MMQDSGAVAFTALRQRLKLDKRTKPEMLAAAVDLALDRNLLPTKACSDRKLPPGSHTRAKALADRIVANGLLDLCNSDAQKELAVPPLAIAGLPQHLLLQPSWIAEHASNLRDVSAGPPVLSSDGKGATRNIFARLDNQSEQLSVTIEYIAGCSSDLKLLADRHRRREEAAILSLDCSAAAEHRAKKARQQQGLREQRQGVDEDKVLQSALERLISQVERRADTERRREEESQRLCMPDRAAALHIGDLAYIRHPDFPPPYLQLAVLRRVHRSGAKVDVQLCHLSPPEMGFKGVDRIILDGMLRGMDTLSVIAPVVPRVHARDREVYVREFWPTSQLWNAAKLAEKQSHTAAARLYSHFRPPACPCKCPPNPFATNPHDPNCALLLGRVPLLSELACAALPSFFVWNSAQWKSIIRPVEPDEMERASERECMLRV